MALTAGVVKDWLMRRRIGRHLSSGSTSNKFSCLCETQTVRQSWGCFSSAYEGKGGLGLGRKVLRRAGKAFLDKVDVVDCFFLEGGGVVGVVEESEQVINRPNKGSVETLYSKSIS